MAAMKITKLKEVKRIMAWHASDPHHLYKEYGSVMEFLVAVEDTYMEYNVLDTHDGEWISLEEL